MITKGQSSIWIQKIYKCFGKKPFTCQDIIDEIPDFSGGSMLTRMREANVIRLKNKKKRAIGMRTGIPSVWVFTTEALFILQKNVK
jgi:hypothetical protein